MNKQTRKPIPRIFLSRRHADDSIAKIIALTLPFDWQIIVDELDSGLGKPIKEKILALVEQSTHMIVIWSETSRGSPWVNQEIGAALHKDIPVIPFIQRGMKLEAMLEGFEGVIYDSVNPAEGIRELINKLEQQLEHQGYQRLDRDSAMERLDKAWSTYQNWENAK